jgi:hypothetical protein
MPIYQNALAQRPANMLAYEDRIGAPPRNEYLGALADFLAQSYAPQRTQQMQGMAKFLSVPAVSQTLDRLSYGEPLTTGRGMTTQIRPEAIEAAMAVAPLAQPATMATLQAARAATRAALATKGMPVGMSTQAVGGMGFLRPQAPQEEALRLAQQRAALPPSQGGLGLPLNNTAEQRAAIMFPDEVYHGSKTPENIKKLVAGGESGSIRTGDAYGTGVYTTTDAAGDASAYGAGGAVFPLRINRSGHLKIDAPNANDLEKLSKFAGESMLPSDKARFVVGREKREFADVQDARDFFANQRENWNQFGGGYDRARPEALANPDGTYAVEFTNFDAPVPITSGKDADILLRATGYDNVQSLGYTGHTLDRGNGRLWDVTTDTDQLRSRFAAFDPFRRTAAIAATMGVAAPDLLAAEQAQQEEYKNEMRKLMRQGRQKK